MARRVEQITVREMQGAETWYRIEYSGGRWFKVPGWVSITAVMDGVSSRWNGAHDRAAAGDVRVSISLSEYLDLQLHQVRPDSLP